MSPLRHPLSAIRYRFAESIEPPKADEMNLATELRAEMKSLATEIRAEIKTSAAELRTEMAQFKTEIIKWMFLFWIGQLAAIFAIIKFL